MCVSEDPYSAGGLAGGVSFENARNDFVTHWP